MTLDCYHTLNRCKSTEVKKVDEWITNSSNLFYRGKKVYYRLDNIKDKKFVVSVERENRFFLNFKSIDCFERWYTSLSPHDRTIHEVIYCDKRKLIIDIDDETSCEPEKYQLSMFDFERHVASRIREVFSMLDIGTPEVIMYRMADENNETSNKKLSYHAVVSNFLFTAKTCMGLCMIISSGQAWDKCVDMSIYKSVQCIRMEGSTKFKESRWKRKCSHAFFRQGIISCDEDTTEADIICNPGPSVNMQTNNTCYSTADSIIDMSQFKIGKLNAYDMLPLYRVKPGYCPKCNRVHDKENAAIKYVAGKPIYMCWRERSLRWQ